MGKRTWIGMGVLAAALGLWLCSTEPAQSQRPPAPMTLKDRVVKYSKLPEKDADKFLQAVGPAIRDMLTAGEQVNVQGLGTFRVVHVPAHRDLVNGRPATIPAESHVEFLPVADLANAANAMGAVPAETVPPFQYVPLPGRDPGMKAGNIRMPNVRTRSPGENPLDNLTANCFNTYLEPEEIRRRIPDVLMSLSNARPIVIRVARGARRVISIAITGD